MKSKKVTKKCVDCGKERTDKPSGFKKSIDGSEKEYRCFKCAHKKRSLDTPSKKILYKCVDCGKERYVFPSRIKRMSNREKYRCSECLKNPKITLECIDCGKERTDEPSNFKGKTEKDYRCKKCAGIIRNRGLSKDPDWVEKHKIGIEKRFKDPMWLKKFRFGSKKYMENFPRGENEKWKENQLISHSGQGFWYGHPSINNDYNTRYCELWKDVNPRVHAFFNYKCCLCGKKEEGKSHIGHHVFYVKEACCWFNESGIYYTNLNAKDHKEKDYCIGENPNYFIILCDSCHGKTNGKFENRKKWADYFKDLIDNKYNGKCYLTKEEYKNNII